MYEDKRSAVKNYISRDKNKYTTQFRDKGHQNMPIEIDVEEDSPTFVPTIRTQQSTYPVSIMKNPNSHSQNQKAVSFRLP